MWLTSSSIGRKFVMAITGACLVLFVTFHVVMNAVCILWPAAYNQVCMFLGANWYALIASMGLAALFIIHIIYALWLTVQNRKARGNDRYEVTSRPPQVEWSSKNMLVLGIVVLAFLVVHMIQFWAKMQLQELLGTTATVDGKIAPPEFGTLFIQGAFSNIWVPIVYIIGFVALWFHMNHGVWSMFQSTGWNGKIWLPRLKCIACWWTSIVVALFIIEAVVFTVQANNNYYLDNEKLQEQYSTYFTEKAEEIITNFENTQMAMQNLTDAEAMPKFAQALENVITDLTPVLEGANALCPNATSAVLQHANNLLIQAQQYLPQLQMSMQAAGSVPTAGDPTQAPVEFTEENIEVETTNN